MTSLLLTEKQRFSQDGLSGVSYCNICDWVNVEDLVAAASSAAFSTSVGTDLSIIYVPYVAFGDLVDSSPSTLTVTSLGHVTEVLSPAFEAGTRLYSFQRGQRHFFDVHSGRQCQERCGYGLQSGSVHCPLDSSRAPRN